MDEQQCFVERRYKLVRRARGSVRVILKELLRNHRLVYRMVLLSFMRLRPSFRRH